MSSSKNRCCRGDQSTISKLIGMVPIATVMMSQYLYRRYSKEDVSVSQTLKYLTRFTTCNCKWGEKTNVNENQCPVDLTFLPMSFFLMNSRASNMYGTS